MRKELDDKLVKDFPILYRDRHTHNRHSLMRFGFPGDGWFDLLYELSSKIEARLRELPEVCVCGHDRSAHFSSSQIVDCPEWEDARPVVIQAKEKFSGLRYYFRGADPEISKWIREAESKSYHTCEFCGKEGESRTELRWIKTLCEECFQLRQAEESERHKTP